MPLKTLALTLVAGALFVSVLSDSHPVVTIACALSFLGCLLAMAVGRAYRARLSR